MAFGSFAPGASPMLDMAMRMQSMMRRPSGPGIFGPQQGQNALPTDAPDNGSGIYTGPANRPGFAPGMPPPPGGGPLSLNPGGMGGGIPPRPFWGSLAPGGQSPTMPMMPPDMGSPNGW